MKLASTYITTKNNTMFKETIKFYQDILEEIPYIFSENRWVEFQKSKISVYNEQFDRDLISNSGDLDKHFNKAFLDNFNANKDLKNNVVVFNLYCDDLNKEYKRLTNLGFNISEIMYVNIHEPYWYFNTEDPNGNLLEITGNYQEEEK